MADEHTRKFNDWYIVKPKRKVCVPSSEGAPAHDQVQNLAETAQVPFSEESAGKLESNPFIEGSPSESDTPHQAATAPFIPEVSENHSPEKEEAPVANSQANTETLIDPDTGLEIPEYMQPFINRSN